MTEIETAGRLSHNPASRPLSSRSLPKSTLGSPLCTARRPQLYTSSEPKAAVTGRSPLGLAADEVFKNNFRPKAQPSVPVGDVRSGCTEQAFIDVDWCPEQSRPVSQESVFAPTLTGKGSVAAPS